MPASNPFNLFLKHFLILSRTSEIFQVTELNGVNTLYMYNLIDKLSYISKFPILCYVVSCYIIVYIYYNTYTLLLLYKIYTSYNIYHA